MVVAREVRTFVPVIIKIETEEEFAKLLGLARHSSITSEIELDYFFSRLDETANQIETTKSNIWYNKLYEKFGIGK